LILDGPRDSRTAYNPKYRGTYRSHPTHCGELSDDSEINELFFWFLEEGGELGVVHNSAKAFRFAQLWNSRIAGNSRFEVIEATDSNRPESGGQFIGVDLSAGYNNSLLSCGLKLCSEVSHLAASIGELCGLVSRHFSPELNESGLFQNFEIASFCLRSMIALQDLSPNLFEGGDLREFQCVSLYALELEIGKK